MSTYSNIKMGEIFVVYGNPFSRKNCLKNIRQVLCVKYVKRVNFTSLKSMRRNEKSTGMNLAPNMKDSFYFLGKNCSKRHNEREREVDKNESFNLNKNNCSQSNTVTNLTNFNVTSNIIPINQKTKHYMLSAKNTFSGSNHQYIFGTCQSSEIGKDNISNFNNYTGANDISNNSVDRRNSIIRVEHKNGTFQDLIKQPKGRRLK